MPGPKQLGRRRAVKDPDWTFLSNYAHVLVCLAENPEARLRDVAERVGITERSAQRLITHLDEAGILTRVDTAAVTATTSTRMLTCATRSRKVARWESC